MREDTLRDLNLRWDQLAAPIQRAGTMMLDNAERFADFQMNTLQSYTHFAMNQWRDALEIRDARSLREFFDKQGQAVQEFSRKLSEDTRQLMNMGQELTQQAGRVAQRNVESAAGAARSATSAAAREAEQAADSEQKGRRAQ